VKIALLTDLWIHIGGLIAIAIGAGDAGIFYNHATVLGHDADVVFMIGGLAAMGVKVINGTAPLVRTALLAAATKTEVTVSAKPSDPTATTT
jgi:hypothetical protein